MNLGPNWEITAVPGNVRLQHNDILADISAIGRIQSIGGEFLISGETLLSTTGVLAVLATVGGQIKIDGTRLVTFALPSLDSAGSIFIRSNTQLRAIDLPVLTAVIDDLTIEGNNYVLRDLLIPVLDNLGGGVPGVGGGYDFTGANPAGLTNFSVPQPCPVSWFSITADTVTIDCASNPVLKSYLTCGTVGSGSTVVP